MTTCCCFLISTEEPKYPTGLHLDYPTGRLKKEDHSMDDSFGNTASGMNLRMQSNDLDGGNGPRGVLPIFMKR